ncbi:pyridoxal phosphate-dependent transferase [Phyllosticta citrichinensis]|uniref:Pyridoxal phosphate-dependent transferase n=1 Tax=Phyllosticta citrichinensis TaxID=1130410 RepID=A0ABR1Y8P7_9PEZI
MSSSQKPNGTAAPKSTPVLQRSLRFTPPTITASRGIYVTLESGQQVLDATAGAAVACLGHGNERVRDAVMRQMDQISYCHSFMFGTQSGEELGKLVIDGTGGRMSKAVFVSSGSEAVEAAMKMARQYFLELSPPQPKRIHFIGRKGSYHGTTLGGLSLGGHVSRRAAFEPILMPNISRVEPCNEYRGRREGESVEQYVQRLAKELDDEFERVGPETVCAFVAEPVVGAALGAVPSVPGYFAAMRTVCDKHGALLILDEVMSGMGRTGTLHAWEQENILPDLQTIGKGLGGGYAPIAGLLVGHRIVDALDKGSGAFSHGHTYQAHPVACAAAAEVQRIVQEDDLMANVRAMGALLERLLREGLEGHPNVGDIRGRGLFWGIEFVRDKATKQPFEPSKALAMQIHGKALKPPYSIAVYPGSGTADGTRGDHVLLAPPYTVTAAEVEEIARRTVDVVCEVLGEL